jgi:uncharacterized protein YbjT (DUF2867 family)
VILVTGASGNNGIEFVNRLSETGVAVRGMVRRPLTGADGAIPGVEWWRISRTLVPYAGRWTAWSGRSS